MAALHDTPDSVVDTPPGTKANAKRTDDDREVDRLLSELALAGDDDVRAAALREEIVTRMLPLARNIARRFHGRGMEPEDLYQVASMGLVQAVKRFDPAHGSELISYAVPTITGEIRRHFRDHSWATRVPRRVKDLSVSLPTATETLSHKLGRSPTAAELATELGVDTGEIIEAVAASNAHRTQSLDAPASREGDLGAVLADTLGDVDPALENTEAYVMLAPVLNLLDERERRILVMRFFEEKTQYEIAHEVGISQVHVSRLLTKTINKIRAELGH